MTIPAIVLPFIATAVMFGLMIRPYRMSGMYDFGAIFRLFWVIPILGVWIVYLVLKLWLRG